MKISTEIESLSKIIGEEKTIEVLAKNGFTAWDLSIFTAFPIDWESRTFKPTSHPLASSNALSFVKKLREIGEDNGIVCNQSHAPFPVDFPECKPLLPLALELTAEAGGKICIIHPDNNKSAEENAEMYFELLPTAKACGVKIATENMWNWNGEKNHARPAACSDPKSFLEHLNAVNDDYLIACLDIGHAEMKGLNTTAPEMIYALKDKLQALHIHDNDLVHDSHQIPFSMQIDFNAIIKALKDINYSGDFTLEAAYYLDKYDQTNYLDGVKKLADSVKKLVKMFNS